MGIFDWAFGSEYEEGGWRSVTSAGIMRAPAVGEYLTDGASLIEVSAIHDEPDPTDRHGTRKVFLVEVHTAKGSDVKEMSASEVEELESVRG